MNIGGNPVVLPGEIQNLNKNTGSYGLNVLQTGTNVLLLGIAIVSLFFIVFGGIKWITSEGDSKKVGEARNTIIFASIGLGVAFLSYFFVGVLMTFLGM